MNLGITTVGKVIKIFQASSGPIVCGLAENHTKINDTSTPSSIQVTENGK
uniref:Uncharacterized protein n=1 Tax=Rhizophora mucronata TaxID=61149 RepID=A0A2P2N1T9_RHIMU